MTDKMPIAVLISGRGRTLKNILDKVNLGELDVDVKIVISSSKDARGLQIAEEANIPTRVIETSDKEFHRPDSNGIERFDRERFSREVFMWCRRAKVEYVALAGYLKLLVIPDDFKNRVLNIHPSLIPSFCGKEFYGSKVHEAALCRGVKVSGCTVHFVDNDYDSGPIILQKVVEVKEDDTPETLSERVLLEGEFAAYPRVLQLLAEKKVKIDTVKNGVNERQVVRILE